MRLLDTGTVLSRVIPDSILDSINGNPDQGDTMAAIEARNHELRQQGNNLFALPNIGDRSDWYSDAGEQEFLLQPHLREFQLGFSIRPRTINGSKPRHYYPSLAGLDRPV